MYETIKSLRRETGKKTVRKRADVQQRVDDILAQSRTKKYFAIELYQGEEHHFRQANRGRPGPNTRYVLKVPEARLLQPKASIAHAL